MTYWQCFALVLGGSSIVALGVKSGFTIMETEKKDKSSAGRIGHAIGGIAAFFLAAWFIYAGVN